MNSEGDKTKNVYLLITKLIDNMLHKKSFYYILLATIAYAALSCSTSKSSFSTQTSHWHNIAAINDIESYVDTTSIIKSEAIAFAYEKRIYLSEESREGYVSKIREAYAKLGKAQKADKWNNFSYCVYYCEYDCLNKRFRILSIEDFDANGLKIAKTKPKKGSEKWIDVNSDTLGDYTLFYICDFQNMK